MTWNVGLPADSSKMKLSAGYIRNNESALQTSLTATTLNAGYVFIPTATPVWFYVDAAPSGWTLVAVPPTDCLIALKGGTSQYNHAGGTVQGTWIGPDTILNVTQIPAHTHKYYINPVVGVQAGGSFAAATALNQSNTDGGTGGGLAHSHDWTTTRPQAAIGVLCTKTP